jgi:AraC family transcriptional activator of pobA
MIVALFEQHFRASRHFPGSCRRSVAAGTPSLVLQFRNLIEQKFRQHLHLGDYCRLLSVTHKRLLEQCLLATRLTPLQLIQERIILEAKHELRVSGKPIAEVALALGFADAGYFSRFIKRYTGQSPRDLRD